MTNRRPLSKTSPEMEIECNQSSQSEKLFFWEGTKRYKTNTEKWKKVFPIAEIAKNIDIIICQCMLTLLALFFTTLLGCKTRFRHWKHKKGDSVMVGCYPTDKKYQISTLCWHVSDKRRREQIVSIVAKSLAFIQICWIKSFQKFTFLSSWVGCTLSSGPSAFCFRFIRNQYFQYSERERIKSKHMRWWYEYESERLLCLWALHTPSGSRWRPEKREEEGEIQ